MIRGVYVSPASVAASPEYAARLVGDSGVNLFVLRAGFNPTRVDPALAAAVEIVRRVGARAWLLVGAWWGEGVEPSHEDMRTFCPWPDRDAYAAHERQWRMRPPGGKQDERIAETVVALLHERSPDGICLTHSRFRHPADISGLFEMPADGFPGCDSGDLRGALVRIDRVLRRQAPEVIIAHSESERLPGFLDWLADAEVFGAWFRLRCEMITASVSKLKTTLDGVAPPECLFGQNAFNPFMSGLCGQDYDAMSGACDFVQPLLGYMRWHVFEPVLAWTDWLRRRVPGLEPADAPRVARNLLGLDHMLWPAAEPDCLRGEDEGRTDLTRATVEAALNRCLRVRSDEMRVLPVLRGNGWAPDVISDLSARAESPGMDGVIYQGCNWLAPDPPDEGWR
jgi:hypothetical protein